MACGTKAVLSRRSAADLWGIRPTATRLEVTVPEVCRELRGIQAHRSRTLTPREVNVRNGIRSVLEKKPKKLLESAPDIRRPTCNALAGGETGTHEVDAHWEAERVAVQVDGLDFHRARRDRERDAASDADLELAGLRVMRFTWDDVTVHGERTLRRVRLALGA